jgi:sortase A
MPPSFTPRPVVARRRRLGLLLAVLRRSRATERGAQVSATFRRRALSLLSLGLVAAAVGVFGYPLYTDVVAQQHQRHLAADFTSPRYQRAYRAHAIKTGEGLTRLRIPKLGIDVMVVEGTTPAALEAGAGHYPGTPLPGEAGNVAIAGHRTTYGRPFNRLDELGPRDVVILDTPIGEDRYRAVPAFDGHPNPWVVGPDDFSVVAQRPGHWLTLTTCHPKGSDLHRLVLRLRLVKRLPLPSHGNGGAAA